MRWDTIEFGSHLVVLWLSFVITHTVCILTLKNEKELCATTKFVWEENAQQLDHSYSNSKNNGSTYDHAIA